jgi:hypothetical protein
MDRDNASMSDEERPEEETPGETSSGGSTSFPRGGAGPPQPLPKGANIVLLLVSILALGAMLATLAWVFAV